MYRHRLLTVICLGVLLAAAVPCSGIGQTVSDKETPTAVTGSIIHGSTTADPNWIPPIWRLPITMCVTELISATVSVRDVDMSTVRINGTLAPTSMAILVPAQEPACWTLRLTTDVQKLGNTYADRHTPVQQSYTISGKLVNGADFVAEGALAFYAIHAGDVDGNLSTDVTDLKLLVDYLFLGSPKPKVPLNADMDRDGGTDLSDLNHLLEYLF